MITLLSKLFIKDRDNVASPAVRRAYGALCSIVGISLNVLLFGLKKKLQFQVGEIISCEAVKKSKKLLCSQVKIGSQVKQIVSGIKAHYTPEEMVGKKVMVLVNLKPAKLAGVLSEGMLLCAEDEKGELSLMVPEKKMPSGAEIC